MSGCGRGGNFHCQLKNYSTLNCKKRGRKCSQVIKANTSNRVTNINLFTLMTCKDLFANVFFLYIYLLIHESDGD